MIKSSTLKLTSEFFRRTLPIVVIMLFACLVGLVSAIAQSHQPLHEVLSKEFLINFGLITLGTVSFGFFFSLCYFIFSPNGFKLSRQMLQMRREIPTTRLIKPHDKDLTDERTNKPLKSNY
jgi:hypothetical protein